MASNESTFHELASYSSDNNETVESSEESSAIVTKTRVFKVPIPTKSSILITLLFYKFYTIH